ncbi:MAG: beta-lactamase hydrolase domain-containing protein [Desulfobacteria bacterium]
MTWPGVPHHSQPCFCPSPKRGYYMFFIKYTKNMSVGAIPDNAAINELAQKGFKTIVDLRTEEEISNSDEPRLARSMGIRYIHLPVKGDGLSQDKLRNGDGITSLTNYQPSRVIFLNRFYGKLFVMPTDCLYA